MSKQITSAVAGISQIDFNGDIIPHSWYKTMTRNGRPYRLAMDILAHLVYWHRWVVSEHPETGDTVYYRKFKGELYQCQYGQLIEKFGGSKDTIKRAVDWLVDQGIVTRELKDVVTMGQTYRNRMYLTPVPETVKKITFPPGDELYLFDDDKNEASNTDEEEGEPDKQEGGSKNTPTYTQNTGDVVANLPPRGGYNRGDVGGILPPCTENTTEIPPETPTEKKGGANASPPKPPFRDRESVAVKKRWSEPEQRAVQDIVSIFPDRLIWKQSDYWPVCERIRKLMPGQSVDKYVTLCRGYQKELGIQFNSPWEYIGVLEAWFKVNYDSGLVLDVLKACLNHKQEFYRTKGAPGTLAKEILNLKGLVKPGASGGNGWDSILGGDDHE